MRWTLALVLLLVAACGRLPAPFQPEDKNLASELMPTESGVMLVAPIRGSAPGLPDSGAVLLADLLQALGVPATARGDGSQFRALIGLATIEQNGELTDRLAITWEIFGFDGRALFRTDQTAELPTGRWQRGDPETVESVMVVAADLIAKTLLVGEKNVAAVPPSTTDTSGQPALKAKPRLFIAPLEAVPGDGAESLPRALSALFVRAGMETAASASGALSLRGRVSLGENINGFQDMTLIWELFDEQGQRLGQLDQANSIPAGSLEGRWGDTAAAIAEGVFEGIAQILREKGRI